ncbi:MAG TPA: hypothetical protein DIW47_16015 [Bacteroidetes bacterium]|nr:hypothetical protein [Bacteroidota bacterium]
MLVQVLVGVYFFSLLAGSFRKSEHDDEPDSYLLAGRKLALFPFVATMVTTAYGWILGIGQLYYDYGISAWLFLSLPYTLFALVMAFFLSGKIRQERLHSIPEMLGKYYGKNVARLGSVFVLILISPAMYVLMTGQLLAGIFPLPLWSCLILALLFSSIYLYNGGFRSIAKKDSWKFIFMFCGFAATLVYLFIEYSWEPLIQLESAKRSMSFNAHWWEIITWFLLATVVMSDPGYHQRIYSSKSPAVAKRGLLLSVLCWTFFDFLAAGVALYGLGLLPDLENASLVYPALASDILPVWLGAFFMIGLLATVMSTLDSFLFLSAQTLMIDFFGRKTETGKTMRIGLLLVSVLTFLVLLPYHEKTVVDFFFHFTPFVVCVLVPPIVSVFIPVIRLNAMQVASQMLFAILVCFLWIPVSEKMNSELSAVVPGLGATLLFQLVLVLVNKRVKGIGN